VWKPGRVPRSKTHKMWLSSSHHPNYLVSLESLSLRLVYTEPRICTSITVLVFFYLSTGFCSGKFSFSVFPVCFSSFVGMGFHVTVFFFFKKNSWCFSLFSFLLIWTECRLLRSLFVSPKMRSPFKMLWLLHLKMIAWQHIDFFSLALFIKGM
jgi:hypothetical protein